jgi:hypothetical protein
MKRKRYKINDIPDEIYEGLLESPHRIVNFLYENEITIPEESTYILACIKTKDVKLDVRCYLEQGDFLEDYTRCLMKDRDDYEFYSFHFDSELEEWELFLPPPVVGLGLRTKLRPGIVF